MRIAVIGAMKEEIEIIKHNLTNIEEINDNYIYYTGKIYNHDIVLVNSGVGKVASGILLTYLLSKFPDIDKIINLGVAGGISEKVSNLDVVIGEEVAYFDVNATAFNHYVYGQVPGCPKRYFGDRKIINLLKEINIDCKFGMILSGDEFVTDKEKINFTIDKYFKDKTIMAIDMESCAFAQTAWFFHKDFIAIRAISDLIGDDEQKDKYENTLEIACFKSSKVTLEIIKNL